MAGPIGIDTPDYQRGVVSAQLLLAEVSAGTGTVTVGIPPNAETLVVQVNAALTTGKVIATCQGVTTGIFYDQAQVPSPGGLISSWFFDVSSAVDKQVTITINPAPPDVWYAYADSGVHIVADVGSARDLNGYQYVVPAPPSSLSSDHPLNEIAVVSNNFNANGNVLAAPGAGLRYRVFSAAMVPLSSGSYFTQIGTSSTGTKILTATGLAGASLSYGPSGVPTQTATALTIGFSSAGDMTVTVAYTIENA